MLRLRKNTDYVGTRQYITKYTKAKSVFLPKNDDVFIESLQQ